MSKRETKAAADLGHVSSCAGPRKRARNCAMGCHNCITPNIANRLLVQGLLYKDASKMIPGRDDAISSAIIYDNV